MNILVLCTYPIKKPTHGGQLRVHHIVKFYESIGCQVQVVGVLGSDQYPKEEGFISFPNRDKLNQYSDIHGLMDDFSISQALYYDKELINKLEKEIKITADFIHVEQPWLFPFALSYKKRELPNAKLVYGSQNIEYMLKKEILMGFYEEANILEDIDKIKKLEVFTIQNADYILAVSESDRLNIQKYTKSKVILVPNGIAEWDFSMLSHGAVSFIGDIKFALFCASAHPPNVEGFFDILKNGFGALTPDQRLVLLGSAGPVIAGDFRVHESANLAARLLYLGIVPADFLNSMINLAHCIILPIQQGGGSNLKTAEALWSGKYIVATNTAFRGFEEFKSGQGVFIADDSISFKRMIRHVMSLPPLKLSNGERAKRKVVLWKYCLLPLKRLVNEDVE